MKVLVIGGGGREHALVWKLSRSPRVKQLFCAPGNPGIGGLARCVSFKPQDIPGITTWAAEQKIDLTIVGPELPLSLGIVEAFEPVGLKIFGPTSRAACLESSKSFAKDLMRKYGVPTAKSWTCRSLDEALGVLDREAAPIVVKADGLAAGKGVTVAHTAAEARAAVEEALVKGIFGDAGRTVVIEEYLEGEEVTVMAFTDGRTVVPMIPAQDHKRVNDGDQGPNTGGMGAVAPTPRLSRDQMALIEKRVLRPIVEAMSREGRPYRGVLYAGIMMCDGEPYVLEFNARFGDPETQVILPLLKSDLVEVCEACLSGGLSGLRVEWEPAAAVCVVVSGRGYPGPVENGKVIHGLDCPAEKDVIVFHSGTSRSPDGTWLTSGGRVLGVTAVGPDLKSARERAYRAVSGIRFDGMHHRNDIGAKVA
jgi:phosphoribosylamine--glycine ligase